MSMWHVDGALRAVWGARLLYAIGACAALCAAAVSAQTYPARPVRIIHGYAAASAIDVFSRPLAQKVSEALGQQFIVDPRPGATGTIGGDLVAKAQPDGYTLLAAPSSALGSTPHLQKLPYDTLRDFIPIVQINQFSNVLVVHPAVPARTVAEFIKLAKARPGYLTYASTGVGSGFHLNVETFCQMAGIKMLHVPYRGGGSSALPDLMGGRVDAMLDNIGVVKPYVDAGKLRPLGVTGLVRVPALPNVPTIGETVPGFEASGWHGWLAPAGTSKEIVARLNGAVRKALALPDIRAFWATNGVETVDTTPEQFAARLRQDYTRYGKVIGELGLAVK
jgi:tripartite-type tricarboxylate transporter receptor subunit TctC